MISSPLAKLYEFFLEKKIRVWLESHGKIDKDKARFMSYHSTMDHLVILTIFIEECRNNKTNILCCFIDFRKYFDIVPKTNLWNRLEEISVPLELRAIVIRLYENVVTKFRNNEGYSEEILTLI
jgi:hypothetical protein